MQHSLENFINTYFAGNKSAFVRHTQLNRQKVTRWIKQEWTVNENRLYSPKCDTHGTLFAFNVFESSKRFPLYVSEDIRDESIVLNIQNGAVYTEDGNCDFWDRFKILCNYVHLTFVATNFIIC